MNVRGLADLQELFASWSPKGTIKIKLKQLQYGGLSEGCGGACPPLPPPDKHRRRQRDNGRVTHVNIHLHALFAAVEHGYVDKARNILESTDVDVNSLNADGLSPLDVAVLASNRQLAKILLEFGAKEGTQFKNSEALGAHLRRLSREAESRLQEVTGCAPERACRDDASCTRSSAGSGTGTTGCAGGVNSERDKQAQHWDRRVRALKRLVLGYQQLRPPSSPLFPLLEVCSSHSVAVSLAHNNMQTMITNYKVEWSSRSDFSNICGSRSASVTGSVTTVLISGLTRGRRYFFRVTAGNIKGHGDYNVSTPRSVVPSSWRDISSGGRGVSSAHAALVALDSAVTSLRVRPAYRQRQKKTTIKQLFTPNTKFHKNLRRGVYLACIINNDDKVLLTNEDFIPVIEVDETYPTCIYADFHWLMKVSCAWDEVKSLRTDMEKHTSSSLHFRLKLLNAIVQMQSALGLQDLGTVYHKPLRDRHGTVVLVLAGEARAKIPVNCRWCGRVPAPSGSDLNAGDLLLTEVNRVRQYRQVCHVRLPRGLYLGYLKLQSSVEVVRIVTPASAPNVPPHKRLRDNPHVSAEEWDYLKSQSISATDTNILSIEDAKADKTPSESQEMFVDMISKAATQLLKDMDVERGTATSHRIYDLEVIELTHDVSFIMICPPAELACSVPGQADVLSQKQDLLTLPIQAFEMIHLQTYHSDILNKYSKLSCMLELEVTLAAHSHREAFSCSELQTAKERLNKLEELQNNLNTVWKSERWLMDLIGFARDKDKATPSAGILLKNILERAPKQDGDKDSNLKVDLLQIPSRDVKKSSPGRGSWPGPAGGHGSLHHEFSKSEQQLAPRQTSVSTLNLSTQYLTTRKCSADSQLTQSSDNYLSSNSQFDIKSSGSHNSLNIASLPPSRSEDMLALNQEKQRPHSINMSTTSSPLLGVQGRYMGSTISVDRNVSVQSLSSDSESQSCPIASSVQVRNRPQSKHRQVITSKSMTNVDYTDTGQKIEAEQTADEEKKISGEPGILQVFAAYETGLAAGTSLKLHVTPRTSAREVIDLVVKQLNMAAVLKGKAGPVYEAERLQDFCLVAVIGARERCLRDDFRPLQLQNPWRKGRLYVRLKHDVLAALNHSAKQPAFI